MRDDKPTIEAFIAAFNRKDVDAVMAFFADDAVYHNMPMAPVKGRDAIRRVIDMFIDPAESVDWRIIEMAQDGSIVFAERLDRFVIDGKAVELPCAGVFEIADGKIRQWRDYFDLQTWLSQTKRVN